MVHLILTDLVSQVERKLISFSKELLIVLIKINSHFFRPTPSVERTLPKRPTPPRESGRAHKEQSSVIEHVCNPEIKRMGLRRVSTIRHFLISEISSF